MKPKTRFLFPNVWRLLFIVVAFCCLSLPAGAIEREPTRPGFIGYDNVKGKFGNWSSPGKMNADAEADWAEIQSSLASCKSEQPYCELFGFDTGTHACPERPDTYCREWNLTVYYWSSPPEVPECPDPGTPAGTFSITTSGPSPQSRCDGSCMLTNAGGVGIGTDNPDGSISWTVAMNFTGESCSMSGDPLEPTIPPSDTGNEEPGDPTPPCYTDVSTPNTTDCIFVDDDGTQTPPGEHGDGEGEDGDGDGDGEGGDGDNGEGEGGDGDGTDYGGKLDAILGAITNGTGDLKDAISNIPGGGGGGNNSGGDGGENGDDDEQNDVSWSGDEIDLSLDDTDEEYQQVMADYQQKIQDIKNDVQSMFGTNLNGGGAVPDDTSIIKGVEVNFSLNRWLPDFSILGAVILFCAAFISAGILFNGKG